MNGSADSEEGPATTPSPGVPETVEVLVRRLGAMRSQERLSRRGCGRGR